MLEYKFAYLFGNLAILFLIWLFLFCFRKDLRKPMLWSGGFYLILISFCFFLLRIAALFHEPSQLREIVPGYWNPHTLFNLGQLTGGYSLEDAIYMFLIGGIAAGIYEVFLRQKIVFKKKSKVHLTALKIAALAAFMVAAFTRLNFIYALIVFGFAGCLAIWSERKDLVAHSLIGGFLLTLIYVAAFLIFNFVNPGFVNQFYNLKNVSGILILGIPLEEYLYVLGFGLMWAPFYEYEHGFKDKALAF